MNTFVSLGNFISINKKLSPLAMAVKLYSCKPLMPKNPLKRLKVIHKYLLLYKLNAASDRHSLIIDGDIAIKVADRNYKVINLKNKTIKTIFNEENEKEIYRNLKHKDSHSLYEKIWEIDRENRIVTGLFYNGHHPNLNKTKSNTLKNRLADMFIELIEESEKEEVGASAYAKSLVVKTMDILDRNLLNIHEEDLKVVKNFVYETYEGFVNTYDHPSISLVLSHGDIKEDNLLLVNNKLILIDWEFCGFRSPTFDLLKFRSRFSVFDNHFYDSLNRYILNKAFCKDEWNSTELSQYNSYLNLFYLEDIVLRLNQFETRFFAKDFSKIIRFVKNAKSGLFIREVSNGL